MRISCIPNLFSVIIAVKISRLNGGTQTTDGFYGKSIGSYFLFTRELFNAERRKQMRLLIKQRVFSWTDSYDVYDESGDAKYFVKAEFLALAHQIHVYDRQGNEVGAVRQKLLTLMPEFEIEMNGYVQGRIQKKFTLFRPKYEVDFNGWHVEGDFLGWEYDVCDACSPVLHISKEVFHWGDTYVLDFADPADELMGLMLVIAIDAANCTQGN